MTAEKTERWVEILEKWFADCESCVVAFSGGVDSSLVAYLARRFLGKEKCLAVVGDSSSLKSRDLEGARKFARQHDISLEIVTTFEMDDPAYVANPENRCFHCKSELFGRLESIREAAGFATLLGGENIEDHGDYRPGLVAAANFKVRGPLAECGLTKDDVRSVAHHFELECWEKPASPCLSSRVPYFQEITDKKLRQIEAGEEYLQAQGFPVARVRHHGDVARIEVPPHMLNELRNRQPALQKVFRALGFAKVDVDGEGFVSGKLNRALK